MMASTGTAGGDPMPATLLTITVYAPNEGFERRSSAVAYADQMVRSALTEMGRGNGTVLWGEMLHGDNVSAGMWNLFPGPDTA
jgi:hypothetical protein